MTATNPTQFQLSRVYAEGWNTARQLPSGTNPDAASGLNPHGAEPERTRWRDGFIKGLA